MFETAVACSAQCADDQLLCLVNIQPPMDRSEDRHGEGPNAALTDRVDDCGQSLLDPLTPTGGVSGQIVHDGLDSKRVPRSKDDGAWLQRLEAVHCLHQADRVLARRANLRIGAQHQTGILLDDDRFDWKRLCGTFDNVEMADRQSISRAGTAIW